jgi:hypothetical protein
VDNKDSPFGRDIYGNANAGSINPLLVFLREEGLAA